MDRKLNLANEKELTALGKALSSETRIRILHLLGKEPLCVNEIAEMLGIPSSSAALNIRVLEDAGLIRTELKPAARGSMKMCIPQEGKIILDLQRQAQKKKEEIISMPVGNYVDYKVTPTCGMVNEEGYIDGEDEPRCFYDPKRTTAKLIWFSSGRSSSPRTSMSFQSISWMFGLLDASVTVSFTRRVSFFCTPSSSALISFFFMETPSPSRISTGTGISFSSSMDV